MCGQRRHNTCGVVVGREGEPLATVGFGFLLVFLALRACGALVVVSNVGPVGAAVGGRQERKVFALPRALGQLTDER